MSVRFATPADLPELVDMARQAHLESRYAWMSFNARNCWRFLVERLTLSSACVMVAQRDGVLIGGLVADTQTHWFSGTHCASLRVLYVLPAHRGGLDAVKMLHGLRQWANNRQCAELRIEETFMAPDAKLERLMRKLGYQATGKAWSSWLSAS